jgi:hypothetical protein
VVTRYAPEAESISDSIPSSFARKGPIPRTYGAKPTGCSRFGRHSRPPLIGTERLADYWKYRRSPPAYSSSGCAVPSNGTRVGVGGGIMLSSSAGLISLNPSGGTQLLYAAMVSKSRRAKISV